MTLSPNLQRSNAKLTASRRKAWLKSKYTVVITASKADPRKELPRVSYPKGKPPSLKKLWKAMLRVMPLRMFLYLHSCISHSYGKYLMKICWYHDTASEKPRKSVEESYFAAPRKMARTTLSSPSDSCTAAKVCSPSPLFPALKPLIKNSSTNKSLKIRCTKIHAHHPPHALSRTNPISLSLTISYEPRLRRRPRGRSRSL